MPYRESCERCVKFQAELQAERAWKEKASLWARLPRIIPPHVSNFVRGLIVLVGVATALWIVTIGVSKLGFFIGSSLGLHMGTSWHEPPGFLDSWGLGALSLNVWWIVPVIGKWSRTWTVKS